MASTSIGSILGYHLVGVHLQEAGFLLAHRSFPADQKNLIYQSTTRIAWVYTRFRGRTLKVRAGCFWLSVLLLFIFFFSSGTIEKEQKNKGDHA